MSPERYSSAWCGPAWYEDDKAELQRVATREYENMEMLKRVSDMNDPELLELVVRGMVAKYYAD
jgi:predicted FMN-binding regulatory protein PaiB